MCITNVKIVFTSRRGGRGLRFGERSGWRASGELVKVTVVFPHRVILTDFLFSDSVNRTYVF